MDVIERFLKYVNIDTTANSRCGDCPSSPNQLILAAELVKEMKEMIQKINRTAQENWEKAQGMQVSLKRFRCYRMERLYSMEIFILTMC